jgi:CMP-N-acetylneuraminic acid synthetase
MKARAKPLCIIPARGGSKRLPGKNLATLAGKSLLARTVECARASGVFSEICVSSEDDAILEEGERHGAEILHRRSPELAGDRAQVKTVCREILLERRAAGRHDESFGVLLPTSPLRRAQDLRAAWEAFLASGAAVLMSVTRFEPPPQRALALREGRLEQHFGAEHFGPRQQLEPLYRHDGAVIFAGSEEFLESGEFYQKELAAWEMDGLRAVDVDTPRDLQWVRFLVEQCIVEIEG